MAEPANPFTSDRIRRIHFTGVGGISMSGLAGIMRKSGYEVTGSDIKLSRLTKKLESFGVKIYEGHMAEHADGVDLVIYNARIRPDNPELVKARDAGIPVIERAALLGYLSDRYPKSIGVAGTHGKTTTTSMIAMILLASGLDPTIHIGGELEAIDGTTRTGHSPYFVTEADEYSGSFLKLHNHIAVILNIEFDHPDFYKDEAHVGRTFLEYAQNVPDDGYIVGCSDDCNVVKLMKEAGRQVVTFGLTADSPDWTAREIHFDQDGFPSFEMVHRGEVVEYVRLKVPGRHNIYNALASAAACSLVGCGGDHIRKGLGDFRGAGRRFEPKGYYNAARIVDDYAHHPSEIRALLAAARNTRHNRLWCVFQPHTYTRTAALFDEFAAAFKDADEIILTDIFSATEKDTGLVNSEMLSQKIIHTGKSCVHISSFDDIVEYLAERVKPGDLVMTVGAGDVFTVGEILAAKSH